MTHQETPNLVAERGAVPARVRVLTGPDVRTRYHESSLGKEEFIYVLRHGRYDEFKFGIAADVNKRLKQLQTGSPNPLTVFDVIESVDAREGEKYLHRRLAHKRLRGEYFALTPDDVRNAMSRTREFLEQLPLQREEDNLIEELTSLESTEEMLPATDELADHRQQVFQLRDRIADLMADLVDLEFEKARHETAIKIAIGDSKGIDGLAMWETGDGRRHFNEGWLRSDEPELYEEYLTYIPRFESARFKADNPDKYVAHQEVQRVRYFYLLEDDQRSS